MEDNCFTILCWLLPYNRVNHPQIHICPLPPEPPPTPIPSHPSRLHRAPGWAPCAHTAASHWLSILHMVVYRCQCHSLDLSHTLLPLLCLKSVLYVYISIPTLKIPFFYILYICVNMWNLFSSFWLTSLCIISSRFIHLTRTDSNAFLFMAEWYSFVYAYHSKSGLWRGRGTRGQIASICWIMEKAKEFQKNIYFCFIEYAKAFDCVDHNKLWKILTEMDIQDHFIWLLRNLYAGQKATVRISHGTTD